MSNIALEAKTKEHKLLKSYLEANASECLIEKINNGVKIEKDGKTLINKKTLETFMAFATDEAKKQAEKGERVAMVEDAVVFGWLIHYFEESSIEGILYNEDGTEYKKPVPVKKPTAKPEVKIEPKPPVKKQGEVISMFEGLDDIFMTDKEEIEPVEEEAEEIEVEEPIKEKPKGSPVYQRYMSIQEMYPDRIILKSLFENIYQQFVEFVLHHFKTILFVETFHFLVVSHFLFLLVFRILIIFYFHK